MIKVNELRIGNYVNFHYGEEDSGGNMVGHHDMERIENFGYLQHISDFPDSYSAVALTTFILEKLGFVKGSRNSGNSICWHIPDGKPGCTKTFLHQSKHNFTVVHYRTEVKYVHMLQNLFFALTGQELEVIV